MKDEQYHLFLKRCGHTRNLCMDYYNIWGWDYENNFIGKAFSFLYK